MGAVLKAFALLLGLVLLGLGAGVAAAPFVLYGLWGVAFRRRTRRRTTGPVDESGGQRGTSARTVLGVALLAVSALAAAGGGRVSVALFGGLGAALLLWDKLPLGALSGRVRPVRESTLLRSSFVPFLWFTVLEVKLLSRNVAGVLSCLDVPFAVTLGGRTSFHLFVKVSGLGYPAAAGRAAQRAKELASVIQKAGGYLVPLDSFDAAGLIQEFGERTRTGKDWRSKVRAAPFDSVVLFPAGSFTESLGFFTRQEGRSAIPSKQGRLPRPPLTWEVLKELEARVTWPEPDEVTGFVAGMGSRRGEPVSERTPAGRVVDGAAVLETFGSPPTNLKVTQLRALAQVYS